MAKLDQILFKYSQQPLDKFLLSLTGENPEDIRPQAIEPGELVIRQTFDSFELWGLDVTGNPAQVSVDLEGIVPPWDPQELQEATLGMIGDVTLVNNSGGGELGPGEAGWLLTWDGAEWVARTAPGFEDGVIASLRDVGDVNYAWSADTGVEDKFTPTENDVLLWKYNPVAATYQWAPIPFKIESMDKVAERNKIILFDRDEYNAIGFGNLVVEANTSKSEIGRAFTGENSEVGLRAVYDTSNTQILPKIAEFRLQPQGSGAHWMKLPVNQSIIMSSTGDTDDLNYGFGWTASTHPPAPKDDYHLASMQHVRNDWVNHDLGEIRDVNVSTIFAGAVLVWDAINSEWRPGVGPAPDLSSASIGEFTDVDTTLRQVGRHLTWDPDQSKWVPRYSMAVDLIPTYHERFGNPTALDAVPDRRFVSNECTESTAGSMTVVDNQPYICLKCRFGANDGVNGVDNWHWVRVLVDGYNRTDQYGSLGPVEYSQEGSSGFRTDPLHASAYEGTLGSLSNVFTADAFNGASLVYDGQFGRFSLGYPALDLAPYTIGELGDIDATDSAVGYGLLWDGNQWVSSSLEQKIRLDDLQDVQFGQLGVINTKLVGAWMLTDGEQTNRQAEEDLSASLAVSTPKADADLGTTYPINLTNSQFYTTTRYFIPKPTYSIAEKLDCYIRWDLDNSWQEIPGDGCIELWFQGFELLSDRMLFRKVADVSANGGYDLRVTQAGELKFQVNGPTGYIGFSITSPINYVSMFNWHHVAVTRENNVNRLYMDGFLVGSATSTSPWTGNGKFVLGRNDLDDNNTLTHFFWRGVMQDLRVTRGRAKYTGSSYTVPTSIENELVDTTPTAGDFLSYDGTKWTNVDGVTADISTNSITELSDVDTVSQNPATGDALVWTGTNWEPGIPGVGATWSLNDFTDVSTYYQANTPQIWFDQAEMIKFSNTFQTAGDESYLGQARSTSTYIAYFDQSYTCDATVPNRDGEFINEDLTYVAAAKTGQVNIRAKRITIRNVFVDCSIVGIVYHVPALHYEAVPDRSYSGPAPLGAEIDPSVGPEETLVPCWGVIQDHMATLLPFGELGQLGDVSVDGRSNGQALVWSAADSAWIASSSVAADVSSNVLNDLADVNTALVEAGQTLQYDGSGWIPGNKLDEIYEIPTIDREIIVESTTSPIVHQFLRNPATQTGSYTYQQIGPSETQNSIMHFVEGRGMRFQGRGFDTGTTANTFLLYGAYTGQGSTVLTSPYPDDVQSRASHLEISRKFVRISDGGDSLCGTEGFRLAPGWKFVMEDTSTTWAGYQANEVPHKGAMQNYLDTEFANLDLSPNSLNDIGDVDTTNNLTQGAALAWDATANAWVPSLAVAADISASTIGQLSDVTKVDNTDFQTNDGSISFDVGEIATSRPYEADGGIRLIGNSGLSEFGWSDLSPGSPMIKHDDARFTLRSDKAILDAVQGLEYTVEPALGGLTVPSWEQVKQQIVRQATDYTALFLMSGEAFQEEIYNWTLSSSISTSPNPVYFSNFNGEYSYEFRKVNQDRITWLAADGCPADWNSELLCSFEFFFYISSADSGNAEDEFLMVSAGTGSSNASTGFIVGLNRSNRSEVVVRFGSSASPGNLGASNSDHIAAANLNQWNHFVIQNEGSGRWRAYLNGTRFMDLSYNSVVSFTNGISWGGMQRTSASDTSTYFSGFINNIRITRSWIPYTPNQPSVAVPVNPLEGNGWRATYGTINQLGDVNTLTNPPSNGQVLTWDNVNGYWAPSSGVAYDVSANSITDLADVNTGNSTPDNDDILRWDATAGEWQRTKVDGNGGIRPLVARSATPGAVPSAGNLFAGELYLNMADKVLYALDSSGTAFSFSESYDRVVGGTF